MIRSTPFANVSVNRFGFNVLDVRINLVNTEEPRKTAITLVALTCGIELDDRDNIEWLERQYNQSITRHEQVKPEHCAFYVGDDLVTFRYEVEKER